MISSISSTSSTQTVGGNSILDEIISETEVQTSAQAVILPLVENLPSGQYESEIVDVRLAIQNGVAIGIDCTNKLTSSNGKSLLVRFRYFAPTDTDSLKRVLSSYGLTGKLGSALMGLKENVAIAPRPNSTRYMHIAQRAILNASSSVTSAISNVPPSTSTTKPTVKNRIGNSYIGSKRVSLSSQAPKTSLVSSKKHFDDWDEEEGDDECLNDEE